MTSIEMQIFNLRVKLAKLDYYAKTSSLLSDASNLTSLILSEKAETEYRIKRLSLAASV